MKNDDKIAKNRRKLTFLVVFCHFGEETSFFKSFNHAYVVSRAILHKIQLNWRGFGNFYKMVVKSSTIGIPRKLELIQPCNWGGGRTTGSTVGYVGAARGMSVNRPCLVWTQWSTNVVE